MIDFRTPSDELGDLPPLDGADGDVEDLSGTGLDDEDLSLDTPHLDGSDEDGGSDDGSRSPGAAAPLPILAGPDDEPDDGFNLDDDDDASTLSLGEEALVAFVSDEVHDDGAAPGLAVVDDGIDESSLVTGADGLDDGDFDLDDLLGDSELPPIDADDEGEADDVDWLDGEVDADVKGMGRTHAGPR